MADIENEQYIPVEEAGRILGVTPRQANRYGTEGKIRTRKAGKRIMYHRGDVEALAEDLGVAFKPQKQQPQMELMPPGEVLNYLQQRDAQVYELTSKLTEAYHRIGQLEGTMQQRLLPEDERQLRQQIVDLERERSELRAELERLKEEQENKPQPWWKRLF